jgi:hypothetical protein
MEADLGDLCFLCRVSTAPMDFPWSDRPLWLDPRFGVVVPGLGGLSAGYVLLAPLDHHSSLGMAAGVGAHEQGFVRFVEDVLSYLCAKAGPLTYWEHGGTDDASVRRSACIEHAHLHIVPGSLKLPLPPGHTEYPGIREALLTRAGRSAETDSYLLVGDTSGPCFVGRDVRVSQYYRREWARLLGREESWDYLLTEDPELTRETIELFFSRQD